MGVLRICGWLAEVDDGVLELAAACSYLDGYRASGAEPAQLRLARCDRRDGEQWIPLDGAEAHAGAYAIRGNVVLTCIPDQPGAAEAALRALFQLAILRRGGLLLHGAGVSFGGKAVVATGPSGAGKSTIARLCVRAGGALLSDETVGVHPDGSVFGTPFFSDSDMSGEVTSAELAAIFALEKGDTEKLLALDAAAGAAVILAQAYRPPPRESAAVALLARAGALALHPAVHRLTFRKQDAAGAFVKRWVLGEPRRAERR